MQRSTNTNDYQPAREIAQALSPNILSAQPTVATARNHSESPGASHNCRRSPSLVRTMRTKPSPADTIRYHAYRFTTSTYGDVRNDTCRKILHRRCGQPAFSLLPVSIRKGKTRGPGSPTVASFRMASFRSGHPNPSRDRECQPERILRREIQVATGHRCTHVQPGIRLRQLLLGLCRAVLGFLGLFRFRVRPVGLSMVKGIGEALFEVRVRKPRRAHLLRRTGRHPSKGDCGQPHPHWSVPAYPAFGSMLRTSPP